MTNLFRIYSSNQTVCCLVKLVGLHEASVGLVTQHYVRLPGFDMAGTGLGFLVVTMHRADRRKPQTLGTHEEGR